MVLKTILSLTFDCRARCDGVRSILQLDLPFLCLVNQTKLGFESVTPGVLPDVFKVITGLLNLLMRKFYRDKESNKVYASSYCISNSFIEFQSKNFRFTFFEK